MKVLFITDLYPIAGITQTGTFISAMARGLPDEIEADVWLLQRWVPPVRIFRRAARPLFVGLFSWFRGAAAEFSAPIDGPVEVKRFRYISPPRNPFSSAWGLFAFVALCFKPSVLAGVGQYDLIHAHWATPSGLLGVVLSKLFGVPCIVDVHGSEIFYTARIGSLSRWVISQVLRQATHVVVHSTKIEKAVVELGVDRKAVTLVRLGADLELHTASTFSDLQSKPSLLTVAHLSERKGIQHVLNAVALLKGRGFTDLSYVIVGEGDFRARLEDLTAELGLQAQVSFIGAKPPAELNKFYDDCSIFVLPARNEAFGLVYIEAMARGKYCVGCIGEGGPVDLRELGCTMSLVTYGDTNRLSLELEDLLNDPHGTRKRGQSNQQLVQEHFTWERCGKNLALLYRQIVA